MAKKTERHHAHIAQMLSRLVDQREDALAVTNSAMTFMISRCEMLGTHPFLAFLFLRHMCNRNIEVFLEQSFKETEKATGTKLTPAMREEMMHITQAMEEMILKGLHEKEVTLKDAAEGRHG